MYDPFANPVDPIADQKLNDALNVIKQLNEVQARFEKLAPAKRGAAAIEGLRHDADEKDLILSAYIMQADPQARDQVRTTYADQQSVLHANEKNRMNYMSSDSALQAEGKANAQDRFDRMFAATRSAPDQNNGAKPKKSVTFADQATNVNPSVGSKTATQPTVEKRSDLQNASKKTPPIPPDQSFKPSNRTAPIAPTNTKFGAPGFGVRKPDVPVLQNTQPPQTSLSAKRVADESAFTEKSTGSKIQQLQQKLNLQPTKIKNPHQ